MSDICGGVKARAGRVLDVRDGRHQWREVTNVEHTHRERLDTETNVSHGFPAAVSQQVPIPTAMENPKGRAALASEWHHHHVTQSTWILEPVEEYDSVGRTAQAQHQEVHFGYVAPL